MANINLRIPNDLYDQVKAIAEHERRSINSELLWLIERGLDAEQPDSTPLPSHS